MTISDDVQMRAEAQAFRTLIAHLQTHTDVQNIDLMNLAGFCRNCMAKWYRAGLADAGVSLEDSAAREHIYGMDYAQWKARYQRQASPEQLAARRARTD